MLKNVEFCLGFVLACFPIWVAGQTKPEPRVDIAALPLVFEPAAQNQASPAFATRNNGLQSYFSSSGVVFSVPTGKTTQSYAALRFLHFNAQVTLAGEQRLASQTNYLIGSDRSHWRTHVANFGRLRYTNIYPGIDLLFYGTGRHLEHDFIVRPGARADAIAFTLSGSEPLTLDSAGNLHLDLNGSTLTVRRPVAYQITPNGHREQIAASFLKTDNGIGFKLGRYDHSRDLVIDPAVVFSTYLADISVTISGLAADSAGNTYIAGLAFSSSYPATSGAFQPTCKSCTQFPDVFITKIAADGGSQIYSTFLGGSDYEQAFGVAADANGNAVIAGRTQSLDFPLNNPIPHGSANTGTSYGFVTSLSPDGSSLNYSSLLGGGAQNESTTTIVNSVALDTNGNAYISGTTDSSIFPVTSGALDLVTPVYPKQIAFLTKFLASGAVGTISYSALIGDVSPQNGGAGPIGVSGVALDSLQDAYITGNAGSLWPTTPGAYQTTIPGPAPFAAPFVTKISADASQIVYSTFIGALGGGSSLGIAVDNNADAFITGNEVSNGFPTTPNAYLPALPNGDCCQSFLSEISPDGSQLLYSTFFAGPSSSPFTQTNASLISLDSSGNIWLAGSTSDPEFPLVHPIQSLFPAQDVPSNRTGFVSRFDPTGQSLTFSTYFGDLTLGGQVNGLAIGASGKAYIAGFTGSELFTSSGAYLASVPPPAPNNQITYGYSAAIDADALGAAICLASPLNQALSFPDTPINTTISRQVGATNCGSADLNISSIQSSNDVFTIPQQTNTCLQPIAPKNSCTFTVLFAPLVAQPYGGTVAISSNAAIPQADLRVFGTGAVPIIQFEPSSETFDPQFVGVTSPARDVVIMNSGRAPLDIDLAHTTVTGPFTLTNLNCDQAVFPTQSCVLSLRFTPQAAGDASGTLTIVSNDPANPSVTVSLLGTGYDSYPVPALTSVLNPDIALGSTSVMVRISGNNFFPASTVKVNGAPQSTTYLSSTFLEAQLDDSLLNNVGQLSVAVSNPAPGGGQSAPVTINVYRSIPVSASSLVFDSFRQLLWAAIPASSPANANSIVSIDPVTGDVSSPVKVGNDPHTLALSDDGHYLYASLNGDHAIDRIDLDSRTIEKILSLPTDSTFGNLVVGQMKVVPGSPKSLVATLFLPAGDPAEDGISLFNDNGLVNWLPNDFQHQNIAIDSFAFAGNPPQVYALPFTTGAGAFFSVFTLDASGIHNQSPGNFVGGGGTVVSDGNLLYVSNGQIWDAPSKQQVGMLNPAPRFPPSVVPDDSAERVFVLNQFAQYASTQATDIDVYDQNSGSLTSSIPFVSLAPLSSADLLRWGADGFAFRVTSFPPNSSNDQIVLFTDRVAQSRISLSVSGSSLQFGSLGIGSKSDAMTVTLTNSGNLDAVIGSISVSGDFSQVSQCTNIAAGGNCQINVSFNPSAIGFRSGVLTIGSEAVVKPLTVTLSGTGTAAVAGVSTPSLTFASQIVNTSSAPQSVTLSNSGNVALAISGIAITGDFSQTNNCTLVAPGASCTVTVIFEPTIAGTRSGLLTINDNDTSRSQSVTLTGAGADVQIAPTVGSGTTSSAKAGQPASYNLSVSPAGGFTGLVTFSCSNLPQFASCKINPPSATLDTSALNVTVTISTSQQSATIASHSQILFAGVSWLALLILVPLWKTSARIRSMGRVKLSLLLLVIALAGLPIVACGGGGASMAPANPMPIPSAPSTPKGTYTVNFTVTSTGVSKTIPLTLVVQ